MVKQEEINANFIEVIQFMKREYGYTQEFIVKKAKLGKSSISKIINGGNVGDKTINKLCDAFKQLNPDFFYGRSQFKTLDKMDEMENEIKSANGRIIETSLSSSYTDKLIASLEKQVKDKDEQLADKERIIKLMEQKIEVLEAMQHIDADNPLKNYPFFIGAAETDKHKPTKI